MPKKRGKNRRLEGSSFAREEEIRSEKGMPPRKFGLTRIGKNRRKRP